MTDFDTFWEAYPLKVAKGAARKMWVKTEKIRPPIAEVLDAIKRYIEYRNTSDFLQFKHPATWINSECWADVYDVEKSRELIRPSITCMTCRQKVTTWADGKCKPCWEKYMGIRESA